MTELTAPTPAGSADVERVEPRRRRLLRWGLRGCLLLVALLVAFLLWVRLTCFAEPPPLEGEPAIRSEALRTEPSGRVCFGPCWFERRPGRSLMYLEGDPYSIGYANARMSSDWIVLQERSLMETTRRFLPSDLQFWGITLLVLVNNRSLPSFVRPEYQYEILGLADGSEDPFPGLGPRYHRILNYHAAHDISHWVWDEPVVGCTAFTAVGARTRDGHLLVGRNFDFEAGRLFDENKIIGLYRPDEGLAFLSVAWPGMAGAVTGINEERIFCSINGAHSQDRGRIGTPVSLVVRELLQYARALDEAVEVIRSAEVFVADSYLVADGETGEAVVVEKTPARCAVRGMEGGLLLQSNHFETEELAGDAGNRVYLEEGTSAARRARLAELVESASGSIDVEAAVAILRDRAGVGGKPLAAGNRSAINAMIATHSVVADVTAGILWVSRGPHQLGELDAYALERFGTAEPPAPSIPADPALTDGTYARLLAEHALLESCRGELEGSGRLAQGSFEALEATLHPGPLSPDVLELLAKALEAAGRRGDALVYYRQALEADPPFLANRKALAESIRRLEEEGRTR